MRIIRVALPLIFLLVSPALHADVTIRYQTDLKFGALVPPQVAQQALSNQKTAFPMETQIHIKGDKGYSNASMTASLIDFAKQEITLMNPANKHYSTVPIQDYWAALNASMPAMPALPPDAQKILQSIKGDFSCRKTGKTDTLETVRVEENVCNPSISMPIPPNLPLPPGLSQPGQPVPLLKMEMHQWTPAVGEASRVPALAEFGAYTATSSQLLNPGAALQQMLTRLPFIGQTFGQMMDQFSNKQAATLKMHMDVFVPVLAQIAPILQAQGHPLPPGLDPNASLAGIDMVATEISSAPIADSVFKVPSDYQSMPLQDLLKSLMPAPPKAPAGPTQKSTPKV